MMAKTFVENAWKMSDDDMMWYAAKTGMSYTEYKNYRNGLKLQATEAMRDLKGMNPGIETMYEDAILAVVGIKFLTLFRKFSMIESCGVIDGRKLYAL